jgi:hypothetical protein
MMLRRRLFYGALLALLAAVLVWWWMRSGPVAGQQAAVAGPAASAAVATPSAEDTARRAQEPASASAVLAAKVKSLSVSGANSDVPTSGADSTSGAPTHWDLCGVGRVPIPKAAPSGRLSAASAALQASIEKYAAQHGIPAELPPHLGDEAVSQLLERTIQVLAQRGPRGLALASYLARPESPDELVQKAERGTDAVVARWAVASCKRVQGAHCESRAARAWVRLDPNNAAAWAALLEVEPQAESEVMVGFAASKHFNLYERWITAEFLSAVPADAPEYLHKGLANVFAERRSEALHTQSTQHRICTHLVFPVGGADGEQRRFGVGANAGYWVRFPIGLAASSNQSASGGAGSAQPRHYPRGDRRHRKNLFLRRGEAVHPSADGGSTAW